MPANDEAAWSFNQPVLLKKNRRTSSVLVWTLAGGTLFATAWALLAPLPQTVAVQGKLQPSSGVHSIEAFVPGVVCLLYTSPSPRDATLSRMPSSA